MLWNGGISFGGVISFIFADLIILPILVIYAKYYGRRMACFLAGTFYVTMVAAGYIVELVFSSLHLIPTGPRQAKVGDDRHQLELHHLAEHHLPVASRLADLALPAHRWPRHAVHDGRWSGRPCGPSRPRTRTCPPWGSPRVMRLLLGLIS